MRNRRDQQGDKNHDGGNVIRIQTEPRFVRDLHVSSRLAEFTSVKALTAATGHGPDEWAQVIVKELVDNGIDNAEANGIAPEITIAVTADSIAVTDNGSGIAPEDVARILDYNNRVSSTEAFVSPTRGRQGNALQTIFAIPCALDGERGVTTVESRGVKHTIVFEMDPVRRIPVISPARVPSRGFVQSGTRITVGWPSSALLPTGGGQGRICTNRPRPGDPQSALIDHPDMGWPQAGRDQGRRPELAEVEPKRSLGGAVVQRGELRPSGRRQGGARPGPRA